MKLKRSENFKNSLVVAQRKSYFGGDSTNDLESFSILVKQTKTQWNFLLIRIVLALLSNSIPSFQLSFRSYGRFLTLRAIKFTMYQDFWRCVQYFNYIQLFLTFLLLTSVSLFVNASMDEAIIISGEQCFWRTMDRNAPYSPRLTPIETGFSVARYLGKAKIARLK